MRGTPAAGLWFPLFLTLILAGHTVVRLPHDYSVGLFGFGDPGASLTVAEKVAAGEIPYRDFGYCYGLLPLLIGKWWFGAVGRNPGTYLFAVGLCNLLLVWAFARLATTLNLTRASRWWLLATAPLTIPTNYLSLTHALETVLIAHTLVCLARGARSQALALATVCLFVKPGMAYFLGLLLLIWIVRGLRSHPDGAEKDRPFLTRLARALFPAAATGVALVVALTVWAGPDPVWQSLFPGVGMKVYASVGYGWRLLPTLLAPPVQNVVGYYFGTSTALLVGGTALLVWTAGANVLAMLNHRRDLSAEGQRAELCVTCAVLNVTYFVVMLNPVATSYAYVLALGGAAVGTGPRWSRVLLALLIPVALLGYYSYAKNTAVTWRESRRGADFIGLYHPPELADEWSKVGDVTRTSPDNPPVLLTRCTGFALIFPGVLRPTTWYLDPALVSAAELQRMCDQLRTARHVVLGIRGLDARILELFPEIGTATAEMEVVWRGTYFVVLRRVPPQT